MVNANPLEAPPSSAAQEDPRPLAAGGVRPAPEGSTRHDPRVRPRPDWEIAAEAREALRFSLGPSSSKLTVVVKNGALTLLGSVNFELEKSTASHCVATVPGVLRLSNHVVLSSVFVARS